MHDVFLQKICEQPANDLPRLIYADWLEEQGDPRGEFIRLQIQLATEPPDAPGRAEREQRVRELLAAHREAWDAPIRQKIAEWDAPLPGHPAGESSVFRWDYHCGFPERISLRSAVFVKHWAELRRLMPLRIVDFPFAINGMSEIVNAPHLGEVECLVLGFPAEYHNSLAATVMRSPLIPAVPAVYINTPVLVDTAHRELSRLANVHWGEPHWSCLEQRDDQNLPCWTDTEPLLVPPPPAPSTLYGRNRRRRSDFFRVGGTCLLIVLSLLLMGWGVLILTGGRYALGLLTISGGMGCWHWAADCLRGEL